MIIYKIS